MTHHFQSNFPAWLVLLLGFIFILGLAISILGAPITIVRAAINDRLSKSERTLWIALQLVVWPSCVFYMMIVEKSRLWKGVGLFGLVATLSGIIFGMLIPDQTHLLTGH